MTKQEPTLDQELYYKSLAALAKRRDELPNCTPDSLATTARASAFIVLRKSGFSSREARFMQQVLSELMLIELS